jgi:hypothetical protein
MEKHTPEELREAGARAREWAVLLAPAIVWAIQFQASYTLVWYLCTHGGRLAILFVALSAAAIAAASGLVALSTWRRAGASWPGPGGDAETRTRFMSVLAVLTSSIFTALILLQGLASLVFRPCD